MQENTGNRGGGDFALISWQSGIKGEDNVNSAE